MARDAARQMRVLDRTLTLVAAGSSNTILPTYLVWDRELLEECYDQVDGISLHNYYGNTEPLTCGEEHICRRLIEHVVDDLHGVDDPRLEYVEDVLRLPPVDADAERANLAGPLEILHGVAPAVRVRPAVVPHVKLLKIERVDAKVVERRFGVADDVFVGEDFIGR